VKSPVSAGGQAALHVLLAGHFSNTAHYIAAAHLSHRPCRNENRRMANRSPDSHELRARRRLRNEPKGLAQNYETNPKPAPPLKLIKSIVGTTRLEPPLLTPNHRGEGIGLVSHAAVHVPVAGHFSNIAHYIAAAHPSRRPCRNENGPDVNCSPDGRELRARAKLRNEPKTRYAVTSVASDPYT